MSDMIHVECEQGSELWAEARCGLVTASRASDVVGMTKKGESAARKNYRTEIICEILTGQPYPQYVSKEMQWGLDHEAEARAAYELHTGVLVDTCGFVLHSSVARFGCSPDFLAGEDGMGEIKCPNTATHLGWLMANKIPLDHMPQMVAELACTGRQWCDFVSFDPRLPRHLQLFICRLHRDEKWIGAMELEVKNFNEEIDEVLKSLPGLAPPAAGALDWPAEDEFHRA